MDRFSLILICAHGLSHDLTAELYWLGGFQSLTEEDNKSNLTMVFALKLICKNVIFASAQPIWIGFDFLWPSLGLVLGNMCGGGVVS